MKAAAKFRESVIAENLAPARIAVTAYGSPAWTSKGHATDRALVLGLAGKSPDTVDPDQADAQATAIKSGRPLSIGDRQIALDPNKDIVFHFGEPLLRHPGALTFEAFNASGRLLLGEVWYSVGGGFLERDGDDVVVLRSLLTRVPLPYLSATDLLAITATSELSIPAIATANKRVCQSETQTHAFLDAITDIMSTCIERGINRRGVLPRPLRVLRRSANIYAKLLEGRLGNNKTPHEAMDYVSTFPMVVSEENACGGRIVTAPINGASGVIPSVLRYHQDFCGGHRGDTRTILLTASVIGDLIKRNTSISGSAGKSDCQGEVGSAATMAAAGPRAARGGTPAQFLNAAEIGIEHHLDIICEPIEGLIQIPCIERNAFGAVKAINATSIALNGDGSNNVSLDQVIQPMF